MEEIVINIFTFIFLFIIYFITFIMLVNRSYKTEIVKAKYASKLQRSKKEDGYFVRPRMYFTFTTKNGSKEMKEFSCKMKRKGQTTKLIYSRCKDKLIDKVYSIIFVVLCFITQLFLLLGFVKSLGRIYLILTVISITISAYFYLSYLDKLEDKKSS